MSITRFPYFSGFLLRFLPHPALTKSIHFPRVLLLCSISMGLYFGTKAVHLDVCGPIAVILACFLAASGWKKDNPNGVSLIAKFIYVYPPKQFPPRLDSFGGRDITPNLESSPVAPFVCPNRDCL
jgi:hypothetical protein